MSDLSPNESSYPSREEMVAAAEAHGFTIDDAFGCPIQGVVVSYSRPTGKNETLFGIPVAGPRVEHDTIERHYCPGDADDETMAVTFGRAFQRTIWDMEEHGRV